MTDVELLPLPKWLLEGFTDPTIERLCDYARANVAHATAAKDAEIERLRAEEAESFQKYVDASEARIEAEARAERLAEALRELVEYVQETAHHNAPAAAASRAALRDHDQEEGSGAFWGSSPKSGGPDWTGFDG